MREKIIELPDLDEITQGGNERWLVQQYDKLYKKKDVQFAFVYFNIKGFMSLNNKYGRDESNDILKLVHGTIKDCLDYNEYVARIYADNFNVLIRYDSEDGLLDRVYQINMAVHRIPDPKIYNNLYISMGIYMLPGKPVDFFVAQDKANICRIMCPRINHRNSSFEFYSDEYYEVFMKKFEIAEKTVHALENKRFVPFLQPKIRLSDEKIVGAEVLLRWFDMNGTIIPLQEYLPLLDHNGYIREVDLFIFEEVCKMMEECLLNNRPMVPVSFNISKAYFNTDSFVEDYLKIFQKYKIPREYIEFELLESISFYDTKRLINTVSKIKEAGFRCSLDDFGSGYSSFNVLVNISIDTLKIDRQFFLNNGDEKGKIVIEAIVNMAKKLGIHIVAEGVEEKEYIDFLKKIDCDMVQGFYYYKPMSVPEFHKLISSANVETISSK